MSEVVERPVGHAHRARPGDRQRAGEIEAGFARTVAHQHIAWVLNASSQDDVLKRLEPFKLDGVVQKIACPFLMLHGEGDEQIPLAEAQKCFDAVGAKNKTMKLFTREEGGYHHCQIDNQSICAAYMWDWLEQVLEPTR